MKKSHLKKLIQENITDWLRERSTTEEGESKDMAYTEKAPIKEAKSVFEDKVTKDGNVYLVVKPSKDTKEGGIVRSEKLESLVGEGFIGVYTTGEKALAAGKKALKARDANLKETYKKGQTKVKALETTISELRTQIEGKMQEAVSNPDMRESLQTESNSLLEKLTTLEAQCNRLKDAIEKEGLRLEKKSSKKKKETLASRKSKEDDSKDEE